MIARMPAFFQVGHCIPGHVSLHPSPPSPIPITDCDTGSALKRENDIVPSGESCIQCGRDDSPKD